MHESEIYECLTDSDGSTRDITFTPSSMHNLKAFLCLFLVAFDEGELYDQDGEAINLTPECVDSYVKTHPEGCIHGQLQSSNSFVSQVHLFIDWPEDEKVCIEISYFPSDLKNNFTVLAFFEILNKWWALLESDEVFVRYENASWEFYNPKDLGVFYHSTRA